MLWHLQLIIDIYLTLTVITTSDGNLEVVRGTSINTRVPVKDIVFIATCFEMLQ